MGEWKRSARERKAFFENMIQEIYHQKDDHEEFVINLYQGMLDMANEAIAREEKAKASEKPITIDYRL